MAIRIIISPEKFTIGKEEFPIEVNYALTPFQMFSHLPIVWWTVPLDKFTITGEGAQKFICFYIYVTADNGVWLREVKEFCVGNTVKQAKAEHLFIFGAKYPNEYGKEKGKDKIIAGGTTWPDSHEYLDEMLALSWDPFYHQPGRIISVVDDLGPYNGYCREAPFPEGTRFLAYK